MPSPRRRAARAAAPLAPPEVHRDHNKAQSPAYCACRALKYPVLLVINLVTTVEKHRMNVSSSKIEKTSTSAAMGPAASVNEEHSSQSLVVRVVCMWRWRVNLHRDAIKVVVSQLIRAYI